MKITKELIEQINDNVYQKPSLDLNSQDFIDEKQIEALVNALNNNSYVQELNLSHSSLMDEEAKALRALTKILTINLSNNLIGKLGASALSKNEKFVSLNLGNNVLDDEGIEALSSNNTLRTLDIRGNDITEESINFLNNMPLQELSIGNSAKIGDDAAKLLSGHKTLSILNFSQSELSRKGVEPLIFAPKIKKLSLFFNNLTSSTLEGLKTGVISSLTDLDLSNNKLDDAAIEPLLAIKGLKRLSLARNKLTNQGIKMFFEKKDRLLKTDILPPDTEEYLYEI